MIAVKSMICGIDVHPDVSHECLDLVNVRHWDMAVQLAEMHHQRTFGSAIEMVDNTATVITRRRIHALQVTGAQPGQQAAKTVSNHADLAPL